MRATCAYCHTEWDDATLKGQAPSYYFSSATQPKGRNVSAAQIMALGEDILTCPLDDAVDRTKLGYAADSFTPAGASMATGDDRYTEGDETDSSKNEVAGLEGTQVVTPTPLP